MWENAGDSLSIEGVPSMRGEAHQRAALFSYVSLEERVPRDQPLRKMRALVDFQHVAHRLLLRCAKMNKTFSSK